jgi:hypothetical protein
MKKHFPFDILSWQLASFHHTSWSTANGSYLPSAYDEPEECKVA